MKFQKRIRYSKGEPIDQGDLVDAIMNEMPQRGTIEQLQAEVRTLTEIVAYLVEKMPPADAGELATNHGYEPTP
jgi:hypothetical protein